MQPPRGCIGQPPRTCARCVRRWRSQDKNADHAADRGTAQCYRNRPIPSFGFFALNNSLRTGHCTFHDGRRTERAKVLKVNEHSALAGLWRWRFLCVSTIVRYSAQRMDAKLFVGVHAQCGFGRCKHDRWLACLAYRNRHRRAQDHDRQRSLSDYSCHEPRTVLGQRHAFMGRRNPESA